MRLYDVEDLSSKLQRIFPVQSFKQFGSYLACTLIGLLLVLMIVQSNGWYYSNVIVFIAAFLGSSVVLKLALPARLVIFADDTFERSRLVAGLEEFMSRSCYARDVCATGHIFRPRVPPLLQWAENVVAIDVEDLKITLTGPIYVIRLIDRHLKRSDLPG